ncbi:DUF664 domain-containing protein [Cryobacterium sp. MDB2-10]|uniref:mycothiol transferase n=1 Tax=Cryobacterium sp. MDB2-10 TaxID=1259177 RepID=UPI001074072B|nr:DUF664 domain-containing protein [Cryobacterium sp. MDB2-10]TFC19896.1 DUF664 domain-containing protein [Cryobacterium sp. MDB2-10]
MLAKGKTGRLVLGSSPPWQSLTELSHPSAPSPASPRHELLHRIEETARHAGHADFLREALDGAVGE